MSPGRQELHRRVHASGSLRGRSTGGEGAGDPGIPGPAEAAVQVSYRDCHSFTITNAGLPDTATCT